MLNMAAPNLSPFTRIMWGDFQDCTYVEPPPNRSGKTISLCYEGPLEHYSLNRRLA